MRRSLIVLGSAVASLLLVACGDDAVTSSAETSSIETSNVATTSVSTDSVAPLLVAALPEITGPTVLWFWAPG